MPVAKRFTFFSALGVRTGTATGAAGASTLNAESGVITTEALTTAAVTDYVHTITNSKIAAGDIVMVSLANGTNSAGLPIVRLVAPAAGSVVVTINNQHTVNALNGTLKIAFVVLKV